MSRILLCLTAVLLFSSPLVSNGELVNLSDVKANGSINATAAHGVFSGNDNALLALLNGAGTATDADDSSTITISSTGMFSTTADRRAGTAFPTSTWTLVGKSDDGGGGPFTNNPTSKVGTLTLDAPFTGNVVVSLKGANAHAAYAFQNLTNVSSFTFDMRAIKNSGGNTPDLSHASLFTSTVVPEPTSLITFATVVGLCGLRRRRR